MEERAGDTLAKRIDAALARIERAVARERQDSGALQARHDRLKLSVGAALAEIDALMARGDE